MQTTTAPAGKPVQPTYTRVMEKGERVKINLELFADVVMDRGRPRLRLWLPDGTQVEAIKPNSA